MVLRLLNLLRFFENHFDGNERIGVFNKSTRVKPDLSSTENNEIPIKYLENFRESSRKKGTLIF